MAGLALVGLQKRFGTAVSVSGVTLAVPAGEIVALLGTSGAGKTTILRCIAGHLEPDAGEVWIAGSPVAGTPPERRNVGMVFQSYALFPHLTVRRNVAFGPERRGAPRAEAAAAADRMLERLQLGRKGDKYPRQLSGGEQQRVAVARALAIRPQVLLLDEPLSSLDAALRRDLRGLLTGLQREFGATTVWVTHDQEEALSVADRVAVLHRGRLHQFGTPLDLHTRPADPFVARFVGKMNLLRAVPGTGGLDRWRLRDGPEVQIARDAAPEERPAGDVPAAIGARPEVIQLGHPPPTPGFNSLEAKALRVGYLGDRLEVELEVAGGHRLTARGNTLFSNFVQEGERVRIHWPVEDTRLFLGNPPAPA